MYDEDFATIPQHYGEPVLDFDMFRRAITAVDPDLMQLPEDSDDFDLGEFVARNVLQDPEFTKTVDDLAYISSWDGTFFENLDPYITLRLLGENPSNLDKHVIWRSADVVDGGWVEESDLFESLPEIERILIVTEGSSDGAILEKSLPYVAADVADFFTFVDMQENYPFTGTGNLVRFCQGLARIRIQNRILIILDNDTAGCAAYARIRNLDLPPSMSVMLLPALPEFGRVRTLGPSGETYEDVNGRAVAIEFFLDLAYDTGAAPVVRWTSFGREMDAYQGELVGKESYVRKFMSAVGRSGYDFEKLGRLWDSILVACVRA